MQTTTFSLLLLAVTLTLTGPEAVAARPDEPEAKEQPKKTVKAKKKRVPRGSRKKESEFSRAMRRNELLREPDATEAKQ